MFLPEELKRLETQRRSRVIIATILLGIGVVFGIGGVVSDLVQKHEEKVAAAADRIAAQKEREALESHATTLSDQVTKLLGEQTAAANDARDARKETKAARAELSVAKKELSGQILKTESTLSTNINQYRTDTTTAVGKILRPPRTLTSEQRLKITNALRKAGVHEVAIRHSQGSDESQQYTDALSEAIKDAGWIFRRPKFLINDTEMHGVVILVPDANNVTDGANQLWNALKSAGLEVTGLEITGLEKDTFDLMVGLQ